MFDIAIIGGGINGCAIARDAAGRGYKVYLAEQKDLASGTSSCSTKLIHGGLRYLEHWEFRLVRESLKEREVLWSIAPHIIWPLRFVLPYKPGLRPAWLLRLGLLIYDHLGGRKHLPATRTLNMKNDPVAEGLKPGFCKGFEYSDCWVDDARFVVLSARDAAAKGAEIHTRMHVERARRESGHWVVESHNLKTGEKQEIQAKILVNAAGPWVDKVLSDTIGIKNPGNVRMIQGSHIIVKKIYDHDRCFIFQNQDGRIFFAIPYERDFTLIGTTDQDYHGDPGAVRITESEIDYLCEAASAYFRKLITPEQIVWSYSGVRPLYNDGATKAQEATREYILKTEGESDEAKLINVFGGKITTCRKLAGSVMEHIESILGRNTPAWTGTAPLPGGDFPFDGVDAQVEKLLADYPFIDRHWALRLIHSYGSLAWEMLADATKIEDLGIQFGAGLSEREVIYLKRFEWAQTAEDIIWRRSKLGLRMLQDEVERLDEWLRAYSETGHDTDAGGSKNASKAYSAE